MWLSVAESGLGLLVDTEVEGGATQQEAGTILHPPEK